MFIYLFKDCIRTSVIIFAIVLFLPSKILSQVQDKGISSVVRESVIIAGDAGNTKKYLMDALVRQVLRNTDKTVVLFLGDNIYPDGLPDEGEPGFQKANTLLRRQTEPLAAHGAKAIFIPGNHDWDHSGPEGLRRLRNESREVEKYFGSGSFLPQDGCPGPVIAKDLEWLRIIAIDSQWWLHRFDKPQDQSSGCNSWTDSGVASQIKEFNNKKNPNQQVLFIQHHPLESVGKHSKNKGCFQNMGCKRYQQMRSDILNALSDRPPLLCAAGHDHSLQHLAGNFGCRNFIVSGSMSSVTEVYRDERTRYAAAKNGFMRLDLMGDRRVRLQIIEIKNDNEEELIAYETYLD